MLICAVFPMPPEYIFVSDKAIPIGVGQAKTLLDGEFGLNNMTFAPIWFEDSLKGNQTLLESMWNVTSLQAKFVDEFWFKADKAFAAPRLENNVRVLLLLSPFLFEQMC